MNTSYAAAGSLVVVLVLWMASGLLRSDAPDADTGTDTDASTSPNAGADTAGAALMKVQVTPATLEPVTRELTLQGQLDPNRHLVVTAGTEGRVESLEVAKGSRVISGELLIGLEMEGRTSLLSEARARVTTALSEQKAAKKLQRQGLQSELQLQNSQANLASARANLQRIELDIAETAITAPFAGVVNKLPVEIGERVEKGQPVLELIDDQTLIATAMVAQQNISLLSVGQEIQATTLEGGKLPGTIRFISAMADEGTRSFAIEAAIDNSDLAVAAGISTSLIIAVETLNALFVSPSVIVLGEQGELGVRVVNANDEVEFLPVDIVRSNTRGAWVSGVPEGARVITLGQGFVNDGERVAPQLNTDVNQANS